MMKTPGRCPNTEGCALAKRRRTVLVELKQPFVCPTCGSALVPPPVSTMPDLKLLAGAGGAAALVVAALVFWLSSGKPPPHQLQAPPAHKPVIQAPVPAPVAPPPPPPMSDNGSSGPGGPTTVTIPPQLLTAAGVTSPSGSAPAGTGAVTPLTPPPPAVVPPAPPPPAPALPARHREHRVVAASRATGAKSPPLSMQALNASHPEYPDVYEDTDRKGEVTVTCVIKPDGSATGCKIVHQEGGAAFAKSVLDWLALDSTRFPPLLKHGRPATLPFTWNVNFDP